MKLVMVGEARTVPCLHPSYSEPQFNFSAVGGGSILIGYSTPYPVYDDSSQRRFKRARNRSEQPLCELMWRGRNSFKGIPSRVSNLNLEAERPSTHDD